MTSTTRSNLLLCGIVAIFLAAIAPTLPMLEFSNGAEALNVTTALEIRRSGNWMIPTLQGETRLAKPPLTAWITAISIRDRTLEEIRSTDAGVRDAAFRRLALETRLPALLAAAGIIVATYAFARACGAGLGAAVIAGSMLLMLRFCRYATTDIYLAMWVAIANACLASAIFRARWWSGCIGAGIALGFAILTKGPVALVMSVVPCALATPLCSRSGKPRWSAVCAGVVVMALVAAPWFVVVATRESRTWNVWFSEVSRIDATEGKSAKWYSYFGFVPYAAPWSAFLIAGLIGAARGVARRERENAPILFATLMFIVPLIILSFFKDRAERYALPVVPAASALCAIAICAVSRNSSSKLSAVLHGLHWFTLASIAVGFPVAAVFLLHWLSTAIGISASIAFAAVIAIGIAMRHHVALLTTTFIVMLAMQFLFIAGYRNSREGRAELRPLAEMIASSYPDAEIFNGHPDGKRPPPELGVYLARTITWVRDPSQLTRGSRPKILLMIQRRGTPDPSPTGDWTFLAKHQRDKDWWWAFVMR